MTKTNDTIADAFVRLVIALEHEADDALDKQKLAPERRDVLILARKELRPLATNIIEIMGGDDSATNDVWGLIAAVCAIMDPETHKDAIADALRESDNKKKNQDLLLAKSKKFAARDAALQRAITEVHSGERIKISKAEYINIWKTTQRNLKINDDEIAEMLKRNPLPWPSRSAVQRALIRHRGGPER